MISRRRGSATALNTYVVVAARAMSNFIFLGIDSLEALVYCSTQPASILLERLLRSPLKESLGFSSRMENREKQ
jgi:hypothetical protein